jgi:hypothetical protein
MSFDRVVEITLNLIAGAVGENTIGIPAIITDEAPSVSGAFGSGYAKRYKLNELNSIKTDFSSGGVTYAAAQSIAKPTTKVSEFYIIKRSPAVAGVQTLVSSGDLTASDVVTGTVNGNAISVEYETSHIATMTALAAAIQSLAEVATAVFDGTNTITITFNTEWQPATGTFVAAGGSAPTFTTATTTAAVNIASDIDNALAEAATNKWFMLLPTSASKAVLLAAAAKIETLPQYKVMIAVSTDTGNYDANADDDVLSITKANGYNRSSIWHHDDSTEYLHCVLASYCLAIPPGQVSFKHKRLTGVTSSGLTASQIGVIEGKNGNTYTEAGPFALTLPGVVASGISIEAIRDIFYYLQELQLALYNLMITRNKLPYNESGRQLGLSTGNAVISRMLTEGVLDPDADPSNAFLMTEIAELSPTDKGNHVFPAETNGQHLASATKFRVTMNMKAS